MIAMDAVSSEWKGTDRALDESAVYPGIQAFNIRR